MKKYWCTKNHLISWCLLLNEIQEALSPKQDSMTNFLLAWLCIKKKQNRKILEVFSWLTLMGNCTKFGLLKGMSENSQLMFNMWDKNLQHNENPESLI